MAETSDKGHGRLNRRQITVSSELTGYTDWTGLARIFKIDHLVMTSRRGL
jgi:hypothetical protein